MNETLSLILAWVAGGLLGAIFFGGLWWTVRKCLSSQHPALWLFGSFLVRMALILAGFQFVSRGLWQRLLVCLLGFLLARVMVTWLTRPPKENHPCPAQEATHAP